MTRRAWYQESWGYVNGTGWLQHEGLTTAAAGTADTARPAPPAAAQGTVAQRSAVHAVVPLAEPLRAGCGGAIAGSSAACLVVIAVAVPGSSADGDRLEHAGTN